MERYFPSNYAGVFLWGMAVLLGMIGFGRFVAGAVGGEPARRAGWGLHAVWGMGLYLFAGGLLALFGACGATAILLLVGVGLAMFIWTTYRRGVPNRADFAAIPWSWWPVFAVAAFTYAGGLCWQTNVNEADDLPAYFNFCEKLLSTGSFADPFSWRRLASLGGQTLLQCSVLAHASYANAQAFEMALCPVILLGLILGFRAGILRRSRLGIFVALVAVTTPILRVNTASHFTGIVLALGLFVTLDLAERMDAGRLRLLAVCGLLAAGLCTLRAQYIPAACGALGLVWLGSWVLEKRAPRPAAWEAGYLGVSLLLALLPWMLMEFLSSGSPLFPLFQGNNNPAFNPLAASGTLFMRLKSPLQMLLHPMLLPMLLCLLAIPACRSAWAARAFSISAVLASLALAYSINMPTDAQTIPRYAQPLLLAAALAALLTGSVAPRSRMMVWMFGAILLTTSLPERTQSLLNHYTALSDAEKLRMPVRPKTIADYREAQLLIPEGKRILVCADFPFLFDHRRNPIWIIDMPHSASPAPGLPFQRPPEETKRYLRQMGVEYVIFMSFDESLMLYNRSVWQKHEKGEVPLLRIQAPYFLDFFNTIERLSASETTLGKLGNLSVLQWKP
jgi:hypothetical protein